MKQRTAFKWWWSERSLSLCSFCQLFLRYISTKTGLIITNLGCLFWNELTATLEQDLCDVCGKTKTSQSFQKQNTHLHSSEAVSFFSGQSKHTSFLSISASAIRGKSRVTYIWRGRLEIFLRPCRKLFDIIFTAQIWGLQVQRYKDDIKVQIRKCQYWICLEAKIFLIDCSPTETDWQYSVQRKSLASPQLIMMWDEH